MWIKRNAGSYGKVCRDESLVKDSGRICSLEHSKKSVQARRLRTNSKCSIPI